MLFPDLYHTEIKLKLNIIIQAIKKMKVLEIEINLSDSGL
jgi:hypothetical protein